MSAYKRKASTSESQLVKQPKRSQSPRPTEVTSNDEPSSENRESISPESITIAIFCALAYEAVAVRSILEKEYECRPQGVGPKKYVYSYGKIAEHKVVIARPHQIGTVGAAHCATAVSQQFPNVRLALMVGIGAGIPSPPKHDIRLGDLAISIPRDGHPGVIQYDFVKYEQESVVPKGCLNKPPPILISADGSLQEEEIMERRPLERILRKITNNQKFARPDADDILFDEGFHHIDKGSDCSGCEAASGKEIIVRAPRPDQQPTIHRGLILSGNGVVKNPQDRRRLRRDQTDAICFETEAAGIMDEIPCLVVRGIYDYADTHKQDSWHYYAAAVAAAYCKALLRKVDSQEVEGTTSLKELIGDIKDLKARVGEICDRQRHTQSLVSDMGQELIFKKLKPIEGPSFDSYTDQHEDFCLPNTRTDVLRQILEWAESGSKCIFWLRGMAGTGKSTISRTVARFLKDNSHLGASFSFKRGEGDQGNAKKFFPTLISQLMHRIPELKPGVQEALYHDPDLASKSLREQFEKLLLQPLLNLGQLSRQPQTAIIVIDALDECEHDQDVRDIIGLLPLLQKAKVARLRVFLTSRPELPINLGFSEIANHVYQDLALHEVPEEVTEHDIHLFLQDQFAKIRHNRKISQDWPGDDIIRELTTISIPLFISAATICHYIKDSKLEPKLRLAELLADQSKYVSRMDKTYLPILTRLLDDPESDEAEQQQLLKEFHQIVGVIILLAVPLSINALSQFLGIGADLISNRLDLFRSALNIPGDQDQPVRILHFSFRDFLVQSRPSDQQLTPNPRTRFLVDQPRKHKYIAKLCLKTMQSLKKDICNLGNPGTHRADIDPQHIRQYLPLQLQYSCRYWIHHLEQSQSSSSEMEDVRLFLQKHFLHWIEAMSLLGLVSEVVGMLDALRTVIPDDDDSVMVKFLHDAKHFVLKNHQIADEAPLQIYCAGLLFAPQTSIIRGEFKSELPSWICQFPQVDERWSAELQALEAHTDWVTKVTFSPDGQLLASASDDSTVQLWDTATGAQQQLLKGHTGAVWSMAFSPDGQLLASASDDSTVQLWKTATGTQQQVLEGHTDTVWSVAFSLDGSYLSTNLGPLIFQSRCGNYVSNPPETDPEVFLQQENWIALNGKPVLWLPPEARPFCLAVKGNTIFLAHMSGRLFFIGFRSY